MTPTGVPVMDVRTCNGCGMARLVRRYRRRFWLCVDGPNKCYRHRKRVTAALERKVNGDR